MNGPEIRDKLKANNDRIAMLLHKFILTDEINQLLEENDELKLHCPHEFEDGYCVFCGRLEEDVDG